MTNLAGPQAAHRDFTPAEGAFPRQPHDEELTAADVMSTPVLTVSVEDTVWDAWNLLYRSGLRHLVVLDGARCVGVLDDRRIALEWPRGPSEDLARPIGQLIMGRTRRVLPETPVGEIARLMLRDHTDALPVVNTHGQLIGIITTRDLLLVLAFHPYSLVLH